MKNTEEIKGILSRAFSEYAEEYLKLCRPYIVTPDTIPTDINLANYQVKAFDNLFKILNKKVNITTKRIEKLNER